MTARPQWMAGACVLLGPTASGKSSLGLPIAESAGAIVVAVDSMQVYRGLDIGTAKPTPADRRRVRHAGVDIAGPNEDVTLVRYVKSVDDDLRDWQGPTLMIAGTGLHLRALIDRLKPPGEWPDLRAEFEASSDLGALYARLQLLDALAASRIDPGNRRRIVRALEVSVGSGLPFSTFGPGLNAYPEIDIVQFGLRWERSALTRRIDARVDAMLAGGWLEEVRALHRAAMSRTSRQALGYRELIDHLDGRITLPDAVATIKLRTRQFAIRQERWFRRDPRIRWIDMTDDGPDPSDQISRAVRGSRWVR